MDWMEGRVIANKCKVPSLPFASCTSMDRMLSHVLLRGNHKRYISRGLLGFNLELSATMVF